MIPITNQRKRKRLFTNIIITVICGPELFILIHTGHLPTGGITHPGTGGHGDTTGTMAMHGGIRGLMDTVDGGYILTMLGITGIIILTMIRTGSIMMGIMETIPIRFEAERHWEKERLMG